MADDKITPFRRPGDMSRAELEAVIDPAGTASGEPDAKAWPILHDDALTGLAGEVVRTATAQSEADPAAVLLTLLASFAALVGNAPRVMVGDDAHVARVWPLIVGATSRGRKGTSAAPVKRILRTTEEVLREDVAGYRTLVTVDGPLSSGEGLINQVRNASDKEGKDGNPLDDGVADKRLLVIEGEFGAAFSCMKREGNTLSATLRRMWDTAQPWDIVRPMVKTSPIAASNPHIQIVGHITRRELLTLLDQVELFNGTANRMLWCCARRTRLVPLPEPMDAAAVTDLGYRLAARAKPWLEGIPRQKLTVIPTTGEFRRRWCELYPSLTEDHDGAYGGAISRGEAQVLRLALVYCLLDGAEALEDYHLDPALAVWRYCDDSARYIFGDADEDPDANKVLKALAEKPRTQTEIVHDVFQRNIGKIRVTMILERLQESGRIHSEVTKTKGRPTTTWRLNPGITLPEDDEDE